MCYYRLVYMGLHFSTSFLASQHCHFSVLGQNHTHKVSKKDVTKHSKDSPYVVSMNIGVQETRVQPLFSFPSCMTLDKLLNCSEPQFPHLWNVGDIIPVSQDCCKD